MKSILKQLSTFYSAVRNQLSIQKGFTLIELLVVIGILGILASALIATIDPFEQLKKAQDANVKNTAVEFLNANIRYYTTHNALPWDAVANGGADCNAGASDPSAVALSGWKTTCIQKLIDDGELKAGFKDVTGILEKLYVTESSNNINVCYLPQSKSGQSDVATKYAQTGADGTDCKSAGGSTNCYWCSK